MIDAIGTVDNNNTCTPTVAPAATPAPPPTTSTSSTADAALAPVDTVEISASAQSTTSDDTLPPCPPGYDGTKWAAQKNDPKYIMGRAVAKAQSKLQSITDPAEHKKFTEDLLRSQIPAIEASHGGHVLEVKNDKILYDHNDGTGPHWVDCVGDCGPGGKNSPSWQVQENYPGEFGGDAGSGAGALGAPGMSAMMAALGMFGAADAAAGMLGATGGQNDASQDPQVAQVIAQIKASGGQVMFAQKNNVLADFHDARGLQWVPVPRQQSADPRLNAMLQASQGYSNGMGMGSLQMVA